MATYTERLELENLSLKQALQNSINWISINNELVENYEPQQSASETIEELQTILDLSNVLINRNQLDLFEDLENKPSIREIDIYSSLLTISKSFSINSN